MAYGRTNASGAAIGAWRFSFADTLPGTVLHNTFLAVTGIPAPAILLSDAAPEQPADGEIWFQISDPADGLVMSSTAVPFRVLGAYQWGEVNNEWTLLTAYYTYLGTWRKLAGLPPLGTALADCSWDQINRIGAAGKAEAYFCIGDEKQIVLSTAETITLQIIGFHHDDLFAAGGGKAPFTFGFKSCMNTTQQLNPANTNAGGYPGCPFYATINNAIYGSLPADLRGVMKNVNKRSGSIITQEKLFLLAEVEVFGGITHAQAGEGTQYAYFTNGGTRIKTVAEVTSAWWTRSYTPGGPTTFAGVTASGSTVSLGATSFNGVVLALCL